MKKILLFATIMVIPFVVQAQKVEHDKVNALNKRIMYTSWEKVNWASENNKLEISFLLEGNDMSMLINWQCSEIVGAERNSAVVLYFDDNSKATLYNKTFSVSGSGKITTDNVGSTAMGVQFDARGGIDELRGITEKQLTSIGVETLEGEVKFPVTAEESEALGLLYDVYEKRFFKD